MLGMKGKCISVIVSILLVGVSLLIGCSTAKTLISSFSYKTILQVLEIAGTVSNLDFENIESNRAQLNALSVKYNVPGVETSTMALLADLKQFKADKAEAIVAYTALRDAMRSMRGMSREDEEFLKELDKILQNVK
jgi:hypothetical protein